MNDNGRTPKVEDRIRWDGDMANHQRTGRIVAVTAGSQYFSVVWDGHNNVSRHLPSAVIDGKRWHYVDDGQVIDLPPPEPSRQTENGPSDLGQPYRYDVGSRYDRSLDITEIAKRVRKEAREHPDLQGCKLSVRVQRFAGGQALDVDVKAAPAPVLNAARILWELENPHGNAAYDAPKEARDHRSELGERIIAAIETIVGAYNYDRSDSQTDYFDVNFYCHPSFAWELTSAEREAVIERHQADQVAEATAADETLFIEWAAHYARP